MTLAINKDLYNTELKVEFNWAFLIEQSALDLSQQNSLNCTSTAWEMINGKPILYNKIEEFIEYGFKNFFIALYHIDPMIKQQINQLSSLYPDCIFKSIEIKNSLFFEPESGISFQGEKYLYRYISLYLNKNLSQNLYIWFQKINSKTINPFKYLKIKSNKLNSSVFIKMETSKTNTDETIGFWLDVKSFCKVYKKADSNKDELSQKREIIECFKSICKESDVIIIPFSSANNIPSNSDLDRIVTSRCFNYISIDHHKGIVTKKSTEVKKLQQEIDFYRKLPEELKIYFPRFFDFSTSVEYAKYSLEYYPYKSLSQYFVYYVLPIQDWNNIFDHLLSIHSSFLDFPALAKDAQLIDEKKLCNFYTQKLENRIKEIPSDSMLNDILSAPALTLNGKKLKGFNSLFTWLLEEIKRITKNVGLGFLHGDLCFSNILYEPSSSIIRLIDPRGEFLGWVNQGDPRYDLAKILHSVHGKYDFIINDLFVLEQEGDNYTLQIPKSEYLTKIELMLINKISSRTKYEVSDLMILESLLFITMLPLHYDKPNRQIAFLLTGLKLLNEVYSQQNNRKKLGVPSLVSSMDTRSASLSHLSL